jgi:plastocyanin
MRRIALAATVACTTALFLTAGALSQTRATTLAGTVGPGFTIKLTKAGKAVKSLPAGTYRITVSDRSAIHNFVLEKEHGAERQITSVGFSGTKTVTMKLTRGSWKFYCEPHQSAMFGKFTVK